MKTLAQFVNSYSIILLIVYHIRLLVGKEAVNRKHIILQQQGHCALGSHEKKLIYSMMPCKLAFVLSK